LNQGPSEPCNATATNPTLLTSLTPFDRVADSFHLYVCVWFRRFYWTLLCSVTYGGAPWRVLWTVDLPSLSSDVRRALAGLKSPAGVDYGLVDVDWTARPPLLLRYQTALVVHLDKSVTRADMDDFLDALNASLTATSSSGTICSTRNRSVSTQTAHFITNCVTLTFDLLTSGSVHAEVLPLTTCVPSPVLLAEVVLLLECGQTRSQRHRQTVTDAAVCHTHSSAIACQCG